MDKLIEGLVSLLTAMVALSVGVERVVEIAKGLSGWLRDGPDPASDPEGRGAARRRLSLQVLATSTGTIVASAIHPNRFLPSIVSSDAAPFAFSASGATPLQFWGASLLLGLMASGGSAFWNHALDIVGAVKNAKEETQRQLGALRAMPPRASIPPRADAAAAAIMSTPRAETASSPSS